MDRPIRVKSKVRDERERQRQRRARRGERMTEKQAVRILTRYIVKVEECEVEVNGRIMTGAEYFGEDSMAQAFECDRCHSFHRGEPYFVSLADQQITTTLDWEICKACKEEIETLLYSKEEKKQEQL